MNRLVIFFENISDREKKILIIGIYSVVFIVGFYLLDFSYKRINSLERKLELEKQKYIELNRTILEYKARKGTYTNRNLTLSEIDLIAKQTNTKQNIVSIKPLMENQVEVILEKTNPEDFLNFIQKLKLKKARVTFLKIERIKGKINSRLVIEG